MRVEPGDQSTDVDEASAAVSTGVTSTTTTDSAASADASPNALSDDLAVDSVAPPGVAGGAPPAGGHGPVHPEAQDLEQPPAQAELDVDEAAIVGNGSGGGVMQAFLKAVFLRLKTEVSSSFPLLEQKWLLAELEKDDWWIRTHRVPFYCTELRGVGRAQAVH